MTTSFPQDTKYVDLCSLHSWNHTVNPPSMASVRKSFDSLGATLDVLRPPAEIINPLKTAGTAKERLEARLCDGYSLVKHRLQTGEETWAFFRGPFTPTVVTPLNSIKERCSNSGVDLQTLDSEVGIMNITYSVAWQWGRRAIGTGHRSCTMTSLGMEVCSACSTGCPGLQSSMDWSSRSLLIRSALLFRKP